MAQVSQQYPEAERVHEDIDEAANTISRTAEASRELDVEVNEEFRGDCQEASHDEVKISSNDEDEEDDEEDEEDDDDDNEDDNHWIFQLEKFEAAVVQAVSPDYQLAQCLIPKLRDIFYREKSPLFGSWAIAFNQYAGHSGQGGESSTGRKVSDSTSTNSNGKRDVRHSDHGENTREKEEDENYDDSQSRNLKKPKADTVDNGTLKLACPFNKHNPHKYNAHYNTDIRTCVSPGFQGFRRLKEHLRRTHRSVQCERCFKIFKGGEETRIKALSLHRKGGCSETPSIPNEGVNDVQWIEIEKIKLSNKNKRSFEPESSDVEKWEATWKILFPDDPVPIPWCIPPTRNDLSFSSLSEQKREYTSCYDSMCQSQIRNSTLPHLFLIDDEILDLFKKIAFEAFTMWHTKHCLDRAAIETASQQSSSEQGSELPLPMEAAELLRVLQYALLDRLTTETWTFYLTCREM
ncbi:uncharacterized protein LY89DRAFT_320965 [Mollisia scopiformis]|uniref:C2H2-type domain-containing protein n=1 Tax=Mollisia scopiformis TaxID=149040 RepID=A0A132B9T1_MOLSC|nr:uncharacterized protein LY89DRAFT_320965 [Mollisia scopiformis]KUJ09166.1 hypothetical protein LY89DRAFT_320965 [Mollisia scopiformis]